MERRSYMVDIRTYYGGRFVFNKKKTEYVQDGMFRDNHKYGLHLQCGVWSHNLTVKFLRAVATNLVESDNFELWYKKHGRNLTSGKTMLVTDLDVLDLLKTKDESNFVTLYVIQPVLDTHIASPRLRKILLNTSQHQPRSKRASDYDSCGSPFDKKPNLRAQKNLNADSGPSLNEELSLIPYSASFQQSWDPNPTFYSQPPKKQVIPSLSLRRSPRFSSNLSETSNPSYLISSSPPTIPEIPTQTSVVAEPSNPSKIPPYSPVKHPFRPKLPVKKKLQFEGCVDESSKQTEKGIVLGKKGDKQKLVLGGHDKAKGKEVVKAKRKGAEKRKQVFTDLGKGKEKEINKAKGKRILKSEVGKKNSKSKGDVGVSERLSRSKGERHIVDSDFIDSEESDCVSDPDWEFNEVDEDNVDEGGLFGGSNDDGILEQVEKSLVTETREEGEGQKQGVVGVDDLLVTANEEEQWDSDELRSLQGSDDEVDEYPTFNSEIDFKRDIVLKEGLKFSSNIILRKALVYHSVQQGYDFYYTHNNKSRVTARCKHRCNCEWNSKRSTLGACNCKEGIQCHFKVHATKVKAENTFQIKSMNLEHRCSHARYNRKVTSEYLAERYIEFWRTNTDWKIKHFRDQVMKDLNVDVSYTRCWLARSRAKLIIYGNGKDQYARVWDYAAAIKKYNVGSSAFVMCDSIERPPPIFKRIYICLQACKDGFIKGCRPIIGVDGCHLKGIYPGMCLVAVSKDGNNNIFPVAWAVVEVENRQSWVWFLELLVNDLGMVEGEGLTLMSDRQKGLVDALKVVTPKAEVRYCARHIWANFKLQFSGQVYKDTFWMAAMATTKAEFDCQMEDIKLLSTEAWTYLNNIPPKHWSRHAFGDHCKSKMCLNNVCETFNSVLKDARDKPILTHMEWMRRYVMSKCCEKREDVMKYEGKLMPYAVKYIKWAVDESKLCVNRSSTLDVFEVDYKGDTWIVNVKERTCSCYQWSLTGLPCQHATGCILKMRLHPEDFVDDYYSKARYAMAYEPAIYPLPGVKHWEKSGLPDPLPPPLRTMPGRPSSKKRKKEAGEGKNKHQVKRQKKANKCSNCGELGHYKNTCNNPTAQNNQKQKGGRPLGTSAWAKEVRQKTQTRNAKKEAYAKQMGTSSSAPVMPPPSNAN